MTELLTLLSPITAYSVETMRKIAEVIPKQGIFEYLSEPFITVRFLQNFERLSQMKLEKGMFVNTIEKPVEPITDRDVFVEQAGGIQREMITDAMFTEHHTRKIRWYEKQVEYELAQEKVLFTGFEKTSDHKAKIIELYHEESDSKWILFPDFQSVHFIIGKHQSGFCYDIADICHELKQYNRTASQKISIIPTESWGKEIIK